MFEPVGLPFAGALEKVPNSRGALMVGELARERGVFTDLHPRLFDAYWGRGRDIGEEEVLIEEGTDAGLDAGEIVEVLRDGRYLQRVDDSTRQAMTDTQVPGLDRVFHVDRRAERRCAEPVDGDIRDTLGEPGRQRGAPRDIPMPS